MWRSVGEWKGRIVRSYETVKKMRKLKVPNKLKIGLYEYNVVWQKEVKLNKLHLWGLCDRDEHIIYLTKGMDEVRLREVLLHECLHAIEDSYSLTFKEQEVEKLGMALAALIIDNKLKI